MRSLPGLYKRVVSGSSDDALLADLFGIDSRYSVQAEEKRQRLAQLESAVPRGAATPEEIDERHGVQQAVASPFTARVDEAARRISRA